MSLINLSSFKAQLSLTLVSGFIFFSCDNLTSNSPSSLGFGMNPLGMDEIRRIYVNDSAKADSIPNTLVRFAVKFILQPECRYQLSIRTSRDKDKLKVFYYSNSKRNEYESLTATNQNGSETFTIKSTLSTPQFFFARLSTMENIYDTSGLEHVNLSSYEKNETDTVHVSIILFGKLKGLTDSASKGAYARQIIKKMSVIYDQFGIVIDGTYQIIEPSNNLSIIPSNGNYIHLPGNRIPGHIHLYLVDSISNAQVPGQGRILGIAPREAFDLDKSQDSRIILAIQDSASNAGVTAAHELGHFFGLRHTVATRNDLQQENDYSNIQDGFTDTKFCNIEQHYGQAKKGILPAGNRLNSQWHCFRVADIFCNNAECSISNLMHPFQCEEVEQNIISPQQIAFLKKNIALYPH